MLPTIPEGFGFLGSNVKLPKKLVHVLLPLKDKKETLKKDALNASNLKKLGQLSLKDKIQKAAEEHSEEEDLAQALVASMSPGEKSNAWNQHQAHLKKERQ